MNTSQALQVYQQSATNTANYESTILWVLFVLVVVAPILLFIIYIPIAIARMPKCPNCKSHKIKRAITVTKANHITTKEVVNICRNCKTQF